MRALRSLLVDIYPPNFGEVSLESALDDLAARAGEAGVAATVDYGLRGPVPDPVARLLYRAAQEGVRNVLAHAGASTLALTVSETAGGTAAVEVADDGRGIDDAEVAARGAQGHLGLTALRGLITDAGGSLVVARRAAGGTVLRAEVPRW